MRDGPLNISPSLFIDGVIAGMGSSVRSHDIVVWRSAIRAVMLDRRPIVHVSAEHGLNRDALSLRCKKVWRAMNLASEWNKQ